MLATPTQWFPSPARSPFSLDNNVEYAQWRAWKLQHYPNDAQALVVKIDNPLRLTETERAQIAQHVRAANMALYTTRKAFDKSTLRALCAQLGLHRLDKNLWAEDDGISALRVVPGGKVQEYIPYSNRPINWHTDGYYNTEERTIRAMVLHCAQPAAHGGENTLLDPEMLYLQLRDIDRAHIGALMHPECLSIPANEDANGEIRAEQTGPVFSIDTHGALHMRYTARTRSIRWRADDATRAAVSALEKLLATDNRFVFRVRLDAGSGILSNNVLHTRTGFENNPAAGQERLMYRARYLDRIQIHSRTGPV